MILDMQINVQDDFLTSEEHQFVLDYCKNASYFYGESDKEGRGEIYSTGLVHEVYSIRNKIPEKELQVFGGYNKNINPNKFYRLFVDKIKDKFSQMKELDTYRIYINCFAPSERPYFHIDGDGCTNNGCKYTFLYYPNMNWDVDRGGETQFFVDNTFYGVAPIPNRIILFDQSLLHRATSFRDTHRFTVAIRCGFSS